jgi:hypothetical protein
MKKKSFISLLLNLLLLPASLLLIFSCVTATPTSHADLCADWAELRVGEYIIQNNVWNKGPRADFEQCIYKTNPESDFPFGWRWYWPAVDGNVYAYPEIIFGYKPWNSSSTTGSLPVRLSENRNITVSYTLSQSVKGTFNRSFDIWLTSTNPPTTTTITREIMIWLDHAVLSPAGTFRGTYDIDGESYDYYNGSVNTGPWTYIAFVKKTPELNGDTKLNLFFDFLVGRGDVAASEYCTSIEFGNEVVSGTGNIEFTNFSITVE